MPKSGVEYLAQHPGWKTNKPKSTPIVFEWWDVRPSPNHGYTVIGLGVIAGWLDEFHAKAIALAHNMSLIRTAEAYGHAREARKAYREFYNKSQSERAK